MSFFERSCNFFESSCVGILVCLGGCIENNNYTSRCEVSSQQAKLQKRQIRLIGLLAELWSKKKTNWNRWVIWVGLWDLNEVNVSNKTNRRKVYTSMLRHRFSEWNEISENVHNENCAWKFFYSYVGVCYASMMFRVGKSSNFFFLTVSFSVEPNKSLVAKSIKNDTFHSSKQRDESWTTFERYDMVQTNTSLKINILQPNKNQTTERKKGVL